MCVTCGHRCMSARHLHGNVMPCSSTSCLAVRVGTGQLKLRQALQSEGETAAVESRASWRLRRTSSPSSIPLANVLSTNQSAWERGRKYCAGTNWGFSLLGLKSMFAPSPFHFQEIPFSTPLPGVFVAELTIDSWTKKIHVTYMNESFANLHTCGK